MAARREDTLAAAHTSLIGSADSIRLGSREGLALALPTALLALHSALLRPLLADLPSPLLLPDCSLSPLTALAEMMTTGRASSCPGTAMLKAIHPPSPAFVILRVVTLLELTVNGASSAHIFLLLIIVVDFRTYSISLSLFCITL
jgi:hypothetical protein